MSTFDSPTPQLFSIPFNYILYMAENPLSRSAMEKMYQTCKYFFGKNPILMPQCLYGRKSGYYLKLYDSHKLNTIARFWPLGLKLYTQIGDRNKIYQFSLKRLFIKKLTISIQDLDILIGEKDTVTEIFLSETTIIDGSVDVIFQKMANAIIFAYTNTEEVYSLETLQKLNAIERKVKLQYFRLEISEIADNFAIEPFVKFMLQNKMSNKSSFHLYYGYDLTARMHEYANIIRKWRCPNFKGFRCLSYRRWMDIHFHSR